MSACHVQASATIELYFYGELSIAEREAVKRHLMGCADCRVALEELKIIRTALESRPDISAPPGGDWTGFMTRLQEAVSHAGAQQSDSRSRVIAFRPRRRVAVALALAAIVTLVTMSVLMVVRRTPAGQVNTGSSASTPAVSQPPATPEPTAPDAALTQASEQHFERSKLVVLGLATKNAAVSTAADWNYERTLATSLLNDTRLYRQAAETRGMKTLANVMRDLELVLLQTSMSQDPDAESLAQLQRLIRRRDLLTKMDVVTTAGLVP